MDMLNKVDEKSSGDALNSSSSFQSNAQNSNSNLSNYAQMSKFTPIVLDKMKVSCL
ncbi:hypothetical protein HpCK35_12420 [Helicobacter pylori]|uniref:Uncharacterized protein n=1 Tax=Campylobacter jejuni subsp. doylei TaxID=32021 RepID=A0A381D313_CAMJU|nr:Uncharacterised protein [Campylobacter jejuni subsp. doylei]VEG60882.1 Uncharacterised protein [Campylobacter jejuni subsp. doylei]